MVVPVHPSLSGGPVGRDSLDGLPQELAFPKEEYEARIDGVRKAMRDADVDVLIVRHPLNVVYLSGFQTFAVYNTECVIVPMDGRPVLVVHPPELGTALLHTWLDEVHGYPDPANREAYQASLLADRRLDRSRVGVEKQSHGMAAGSYPTTPRVAPARSAIVFPCMLSRRPRPSAAAQDRHRRPRRQPKAATGPIYRNRARTVASHGPHPLFQPQGRSASVDSG